MKTLFSVVAVVLVLLGGACTRKVKAPQNVLRYPIESEPPSLDWGVAYDHVSIITIFHLQEGLTKQAPDLSIQPALAERWDISKDGKTYTFYLKDTKWSDGVPVRAQDFVYAWQRVLDPKTAALYAYFLFDVVNAYEYNSGKIKDPNLVGIKALDDRRLEIRLKNPASFFLHIPAFLVAFPQRKDVIDSMPKTFTEPPHLRSTGPYRLSKWDHDSKLVLEPNPYYHGAKPRIERVELHVVKEDSTALNLYERGDLDVTLRIPALELDRVKKSPEFRSIPILRGYYYGFNVLEKPFDNPLVRKAFARAIDRKELVSILKSGKVPCTSWIPQGLVGYNEKIGLDFNPELARKYLAQAGFPGGKNFPPVTAMYDSLEMNKMIAEKLQFMWSQVLGIPPVNLVTQEWKVFLDTLTHAAPPIWRMGWGADYPDPHTFMDVFNSKGGNNNTRWKSAKYDTLLMQGASTLDPKKRAEIYTEAQKILLETDTVIIPLFQESIDMLVKPHVKDFVIDSIEYLRVSDAWIDTKAHK